MCPCNIAMVHAGLGQVDQALDYLENAYQTRDVRLTFLAVEPKWDAIRLEPRFRALLDRLALPSDAKAQSCSGAGTLATLAAPSR